MNTNDNSQEQFESMLEKARTLLAGECSSGDARRANTLVISALAMRPDSCSAWIVKAQVLSALDDDTAALAAIEMALHANANSIEAQYWRAAILSDLNRHGEALKMINRCFRSVQVDDAWLLEDMYCEKAMILDAMGRSDEAVATYEAGLKRCPRSSLLNAALAPLKRSKAKPTLTLVRGGAVS